MRDTVRYLAMPDAVGVLVRFPIAAVAALMLGGRALLPDGLDVAWDNPSTAWTFGWTVVLMSSVAIAIWAESRGSKRSVELQALSLLLGLCAGLAWETPFVSPLWTIVALFALMLLSPAPGRDEQALWSFDARAAALFVFAVVACVTLAVGLIAILEAAEYLFGMEFDKANSRILTVCFWFVLPVYWLALLPGREAPPLQPGDLLFKAVATLGALLAVVIGALALLLHAYAGRIVLEGAMPKGQVGWIVSVALSVGLLGWLVAAADSGPAAGLRRVFRIWWFPLTLVPTALLVVAVRERVGAYGVTADRYALAAAAMVSIGYLALWLARLKPPTIRSVLIVGAAVSLLAAVGPINMPNVVTVSQMARLRAILVSEGLLSGGRVTSQIPEERWTNARANEIAEIIGAIDDVFGNGRLASIMPSDRAATRIVAERFLGAEFRGIGEPPLVELSQPLGAVVVGAGSLIGSFELFSAPPESFSAPGGVVHSADKAVFDGWRVTLEPRWLIVTHEGVETIFDLSSLAIGLDDDAVRPDGLSSTDGRSMLRIELARLRKTETGVDIRSLKGVAVIAAP